MGNFKQNDVFGGRYRLTKKLGIGGFSEVWQAEDEMTEGTVVAIKIYAPEKGLDEYGLKQFRREYSLTQPLNHPNLLKASYFDIADGSPFLVMPFCSRGSVGHKLMEKGAFDERTIAEILVQVAAGLAYLHSKDIVHQDIKPDNILIDDDNNYILTDFGISSRMRSTLRKATTVNSALTVAYAPPERFDQNPQNTTSGDVFSMGVMLYELCEGDVPWMGSGGVTLLSGSKPPMISPKFSPEFGKLIQACMALRMQDRPNAAQLQSSADSYLRTGRWDISFIKDGQDDGPAFASSGRRTERLEHVGVPESTFQQSNSRNEAAPTQPAPEQQKQQAGNATRADFAPTEEKKKSKTPLIAAIAIVVLLAVGGGGYFFWQQQAAAAQKADYDAAMLSAKTALDNNQYADAKTSYENALAVFPDDAAAKDGLKAIDDKINEKHAAALAEGDKLLADKKYTEAIAKYEEAVKLKPEDKTAKDKLAQVTYDQGIEAGDAQMATSNFAKAMEEYKKALDAKPGDEVAQTKYDNAYREENAEKLKVVNGQLIAGVKSGSLDVVQKALSDGADANAHDGKTPIIFIAAKNGDLEIIKALVGKGAKCTDKSGTMVYGSASLGSPIVVAAAYGKLDVVKYFIETCKVPVNDQEYDSGTKKNNGWSALGAAASYGKLDIVKYMVGKGANVNITQGSDNITPFLEACYKGHYEVAKYLMDNRADIYATANGRGAYELATNSSIRTMLKDKGLGKLNIEDNFNSYSSSYFFADKKMISDKNRTISIDGGKLQFYLKEDIASSLVQDFKDLDATQDYTVQADFSIAGTNDPYGLIFGSNSNGDSYRIIIDQNGGYVSLKKYSGGKWNDIVGYKQNAAIKQRLGQVNTIKMEKKGSSISISVNGTTIISNQSLSRLTGLGFGFFCQTVGTTLTVDNFKLVGAAK